MPRRSTARASRRRPSSTTPLPTGRRTSTGITAVNSAGEGAASNEVSATPTARPGCPSIGSRAGHTADVPPYQREPVLHRRQHHRHRADDGHERRRDPAPSAVYQYVCYGDFSYRFPSLTPGAPYTVRLHFAEGSAAASSATVSSTSRSTARTCFRGSTSPRSPAARPGARPAVRCHGRCCGTDRHRGHVGLQLGDPERHRDLTGSAIPLAPFGLRAVPGNGQVTLSWSGAPARPASTSIAGRPRSRGALPHGVQALTFVDDAAANGRRTSTRSRPSTTSERARSRTERERDRDARSGPVYQIACGHTADVPPYERDQY